MSSVLVLGGGFAGLLAAAAASPYTGEITVVERDAFPDGPQLRRGQPQARHPHFLAPGGVLGLERLLPGTTDRLLAAGAKRIGVGADLLFRPSVGAWLDRRATDRFGIGCSRQLLDHVVREMIRERGGVTFRSECEPVSLLGDGTAIRGVRVRELRTGTTELLEADLVIDATGRGSQAGQWLDHLGIAVPPAQIVDSGHAYATRVYRAIPGAESGFPLILIQADGRSGNPSGNANLLPVEDGRWIVAVGGTRGMSMPGGDDEFLEFARHRVPDPLIGEVLAEAEPLSGTMRSRSTANRRYRFDRVRAWPCGFVVAGDAATATNPVYGQGLSVAARSANVLRAAFGARGVDPTAADRIQRSICRAARDPWQMATSQDLQFRDTEGGRPTALDRWQLRYGDRVFQAASSRPAVAAIVSEVMFLARPALAMGHPAVVTGALLGPRRPAPGKPPLTTWERGFLAGGRVA
ncbi:NAD(P)/FAD-dependent oxidoreductase [Nocardia australiensis]|uniref:NAD(P)/FAD-dependent oxidoreductase n=1 Tax=Nocardia australiensis TaxID=2887191 RepID=UPI001D157681|nr:FAD-dependent monooxygenase [Nocardia australiensis]